MVKLFFLFGILLSSAAYAACPKEDVIPGEFLLRIKPGTSNAQLMQKLLKSTSLRFLHDQNSFQAKLFSVKEMEKLPPSLLHLNSKQLSKDELKQMPEVLSVEENCLIRLNSTPNDPRFSSQWHHQTIQSRAAWNFPLSSGATVIVAVSDTGIDYTHEDLQPIMWKNTREFVGITGVDDDANGCIDDFYGCDLGERDGDPMPSPVKVHEHGTHVAGLIGASLNNGIGVSGFSPQIRLLAAKGFADFSDSARLSDLIDSIYYSVNSGARVINCSWGSVRDSTQAERDAFHYAISRGAVPIVAAGNQSIDVAGAGPANILEVISVAASNSLDKIATFSNFGLGVDLIAPGGDISIDEESLNEKIYSTLPMRVGGYGSMGGTSMSAPLVAGAAAVIISINPNLSVAAVEDILKRSGDLIEVKPKFSNTFYRYPRLNFYEAVKLAYASLNVSGPLPFPEVCPGDESTCVGFNKPAPKEAPRRVAGSSGCSLGSVQKTQQASTGSVFGLFLLPLGFLFSRRNR